MGMSQNSTLYGFSSRLSRRKFLGMGIGFGLASQLSAGAAYAVDLQTALQPRIIGSPDAQLHMAEYFSLSCIHCANFHKGTFKQIKKDWIDTGKLQFEFRDFPLQGPAIYAHALARAVPADAYEWVIDLLLTQQKKWAEAEDPVSELAKIARIAGIGQDRFTEIIQNRPLLEGIVAIAQNGYDTWEIQSTPSFVINDKDVVRGDVGYEKFLSALNTAST
jgi:protein-disulfide isomerase